MHILIPYKQLILNNVVRPAGTIFLGKSFYLMNDMPVLGQKNYICRTTLYYETIIFNCIDCSSAYPQQL